MNKDIEWTKEGKRRRKIESRDEEREKGKKADKRHDSP
jgi:hypothetical protein